VGFKNDLLAPTIKFKRSVMEEPKEGGKKTELQRKRNKLSAARSVKLVGSDTAVFF
jgi:hypothetical protein